MSVLHGMWLVLGARGGGVLPVVWQSSHWLRWFDGFCVDFACLHGLLRGRAKMNVFLDLGVQHVNAQ